MDYLKKILVVLPERSPSSIINVIAPLSAMHTAGMADVTIRLQNEVTAPQIAAADVMVLCRNWEPAFRPLFEFAISLGIPIVYDLDDHVLDAPKGSYTHQLFQAPGRREMLEWLLRQSSLIRVHSPVLEQIVRAYNPRTKLVWAAVNWSLVPDELPNLSLDPIHIVYAAQRETGGMLYPLLRQDLHDLLAKYGSRIRLHFLGFNPADLRDHPLVTCHPFETDYATFFSKFTRFGYAIGLAPMIDDLFHNSKTNIKYRDYAAAGAAGVYADAPLYRGNGVVDRETGLLISGQPGSWLAAVSELIEHPTLIDSIRQNARSEVAKRYHSDVVSKMWLESFASLPPRHSLTDSERALVEATHWSFTYERKPDAAWVAKLRAILRETIPVRWRLRYYDSLQMLRRLRR